MSAPTDYLFCLYIEGEIEKEELHDILTAPYSCGGYAYGNEGAYIAMQFAKDYPHMIHKPGDYEAWKANIYSSTMKN